MIFLAAAAIYATSAYKSVEAAVKQAKMLWAEVIKQDKAVEAVELDAFAKEIPDLVFHGTTGYSLFKAEATED